MHVPRVYSESGRVGGFQAFDEMLGHQNPIGGGASLDPSGFVHLVSQRSHLGPTASQQSADIYHRAPVEADSKRDRVVRKATTTRYLLSVQTHCLRRLDARTRGF